VGSLLHQANHAVQGAVSCIIFAAATVAELDMARPNSRPVTLAGLGLSLAGLALIVAGLAAASLVLFLAGTVVGGIAAGAIFVGSLSITNRLAPQESRGQVISTYFVFAYAG
jgi:MFS family permease